MARWSLKKAISYVDTGDFRAKTAMKITQNRCEDYVGKEIVLGVRPEHIHAPEYAPPNIDPAPLHGTVEVLELLGAELHLYRNFRPTLLLWPRLIRGWMCTWAMRLIW